MSALVRGGAVRMGSAAAWWAVDAERHLLTHRPGATFRSDLPIPGLAAILAADPWPARPFVLCADGSTWEHARDWNTQPMWRQGPNLLEAPVTKDKEHPTPLLAAFLQRVEGARHIVGLTAERVPWRLAAGAAPVGLPPIPGASPIIGMDCEGPSALLADGNLMLFTEHGWLPLGNVLAPGTAGDLPLVALSGFCVAPGRDIYEGEEFEMPVREARELMRQGRARLVEPESAA